MELKKRFETQRLILRPFTIRDISEVFEMSSNPNVTKFLTWNTHKTIDEAKKTIEDIYMKSNSIYAIELKSSSKCIGCFDIRFMEEDNKASFGYMLSEMYWGNGYMTEVLQSIIEYCFHTLNLNRIESSYYVGNEGSGRVMEKCGMKCEGIGLQEKIIKGKYVDVVHMYILKIIYTNSI